MKHLYLIFLPALLAGFLFCNKSGENISQSEFDPEDVVIRDTIIYSRIINDSIKIDISLPPQYAIYPERYYPVLYMTDGYWRHDEHPVIHEMSSKGEIPDLIVVGIGYPNGYDFSNIRVRDLVNSPYQFLICIKYEVMNYVENKYRVDKTNRTLWGSSYGGTFLVYAFTQHINAGSLFLNYIGASPALNSTSQCPDLLEEEEKFYNQTLNPDLNPNLTLNLYLAVGGDETIYFINSFNRIKSSVETRNYSGLRFENEIIQGTNHYTVWQPALHNGLRIFLN